MYNIYTSLTDDTLYASTQCFEDAAAIGLRMVSTRAAQSVLIFFESSSTEKQGQKRIAGIVNGDQVTDMNGLDVSHFEITVKTVFQHLNTHVCHRPAVVETCRKLLFYHNTITSIQPVIEESFYKKLAEPLPFNF